jgi:NTP pyrophosphatase (non-canonical NTP hydrolase)
MPHSYRESVACPECGDIEGCHFDPQVNRNPHPLTFAAFREQNDARNMAWNKGAGTPPLFAAVELAGEVGEAMNVVKKLAREQLGWTGSRATVDDLRDELADVVICADLLAIRYGIDLGAAVVAKFNKTSEQRGFPHRL